MKTSKFSEIQITAILKQAEVGTPAPVSDELCSRLLLNIVFSHNCLLHHTRYKNRSRLYE